MPVPIIARCHPALDAVLPPPVPARRAYPDWLRGMAREAEAETLGGGTVRTVKQCPPVIDAFGLGIMLPLVCDLVAKGGELTWDWDPPFLEGHSVSRAPIGMHVPEQVRGVPFEPDGLFIKFTNFWTLETPPGWQILFTHPFNRFDLPFETLSGVVDTDGFSHGYVHFPARWRDKGWEGTVPRGTPVVQAIPIRREPVELATQSMTPEELERTERIQQELISESGLYRKKFRRNPSSMD